MHIPIALAAVVSLWGQLPLPWYVIPLLLLPLAFALMVFLGIGFPLGLRIVAAIQPWAFGWIFVPIADLMWRIEAGREHGKAQQKESEHMLAEAELRDAQREVSSRAVLGDLAVAGGQVTAHGRAFGHARLEGGVLKGFDGPNEVALGKVRQIGDRYEVVDDAGHVLMRFDGRGRGEGGRELVRPANRSEEEWAQIASAEIPAARPAAPSRMGPLMQSGVLALATVASYFVADAIVGDGSGLESSTSASAPIEQMGSTPPVLASEPLDSAGEREPTGEEVAGGEVWLDAPCQPRSQSASRTLTVSARESYPVSNAFDGDNDTAWAVREAIPGQDWIEMSLGEPTHVSRLWLTTGFEKIHRRTGDLFPLNAHLRRFTIETDDGRRTVEVGSEQRSAELRLNSTTTRIRLIIEDVWPGERWQDLSISEIQVHCGR